ncbi:MAG: chemotaxis protein CheW [Syntrophaceae bacterium]|nr:chemotaxis protein CheW [Deltaproteobacteria bacterium]
MGEFDELIEEFVAESKEHLADIEDDLIKIESRKADIDPEVINRVFRAAHSIKGSAKFLDLVNIGDLGHRMEDVLNLIRSGRLIPSSDVAGPLLMAADMLKTMLDDVGTSNDMDISEHLSVLQTILDGPPALPTQAGKHACNQDVPAVLAPFGLDPETLRKKLHSFQVYVLSLDSDQADMEHLTSELGNLGEVMAEAKTADNKLSVLFATIMEPDMIPLALGIGKELFIQVVPSMLQASAPKTQQAGRQEPSKPAPPMQPRPMAEHGPKPKAVAQEKKDPEYRTISYDEPKPKEMPFSFKREDQADRKVVNSSFITFTLDSETYAVPIQEIEEIIGLQEMSILPNVPGFIKGVINLRGDIVPIMDLRLKFGLDAKEYSPFTVFLIVRVDERLVGIVVDNVADVLVLDPARIQKTPAFSAKISTDFIDGVYKDAQQEMVIVVNMPSLINPEEWDTLHAAH